MRRGKPSTYNGVRYKSLFEVRIAKELDARGIPFEYEGAQLFYTTHHVYRPDFVLMNGVLVEAKGYFPSTDRAKLLAVRDSNPAVKIALIFQNAGTRLSRSSKTTYGQWADRNGFEFREGSIPSEWIEE